MFLLPALGSFAADVLILLVHAEFADLLQDKGVGSVENTAYLTPLAITRLLLLVPLNYHVLTGTRLRFPIVYKLFQIISGFVVFCHFCAFSLKMGEDFYWPDVPNSNKDNSPGLDEWEQDAPASDFADDTLPTPEQHMNDTIAGGDHVLEQDDAMKELDVVWGLLTLSLFSISLHIMILMHVRSSAPSNDAMKKSMGGKRNDSRTLFSYNNNGRQRKRLGYYIYNQYRNGRPFQVNSLEVDSGSLSGDSDASLGRGMRSPLQMGDREWEHDADLSEAGSEESPESVYVSAGSTSSAEADPFLTHDVFMGTGTSSLLDTDADILGPSRRKNRQPRRSSMFGIHCFSTSGYEDFMGEIRSRFTETKKEWTVRLEHFTHRMQQNEMGPNKNILLQFNQNTPFRVLLHMYAHEEVFENNRLDRAFPLNDKLSLPSYAPQMLCFLLHNAFLSTGKLERWILDRCQTDVHFAHRCFWFIRAWCLQGGIFIADEENGRPLPPRRKSGTFLEDEKQHALMSPASKTQFHSEPDFTNIRELVRGPSVEDLKKSNGIKFSPEERRALEGFLAKVTECGEQAARKLEFGLYKDSLENPPSPPVESSPLGSSFVPIDVTQEYPTIGHYNAANSPENHGFLPHSKSSMRFNTDGEEVRSFFLRTPDFLDSLISIADDLLLEPSSNRTPELRNRLKELEFTMLPSNSIYVPVNGCLHRVWRILAEESIALSTKERVPCIIYLEVIDHIDQGSTSENDVLQKWYKSPRPPQRLNTLLSQVTRKTQKGLRKLRDEFEENQEKLFARMQRNGNTSHFEKLDDGDDGDYLHEGNDIATLTSSGLHSPLSAKGTDRAVHGTRDTSPESNSSLQPLSTEVQSVETLGQWASSPVQNITLAERIDRRDSYGSNALTNLYGLNTENDEISTPVSNTSPRSSLVAFKEDWAQKEKRLRLCSAQGNNPNWRLLPILIKSNDDLRQEQLASQLIHCMASILANAHVPSWLYPYDIVALSFRGGIMEAIPDTISIDSLRKNHPHFTDLKHFFEEHFGQPGSDSYENAKANFVESLAAYSIVCYMLQIKDRHNGNILLDNKGHLIHIDFGFFFLSSPGKNSGFESAPFKLTSEFIEVMDGVNSHTFIKFRELCYKTFIELRKNCFQITLLVQMLIEGNEDLDCFRGRPHAAVQGLQERLRLDLNDRACQEYVNKLINDSIGNWTTTCYDRYQRCFVGVM